VFVYVLSYTDNHKYTTIIDVSFIPLLSFTLTQFMKRLSLQDVQQELQILKVDGLLLVTRKNVESYQ